MRYNQTAAPAPPIREFIGGGHIRNRPTLSFEVLEDRILPSQLPTFGGAFAAVRGPLCSLPAGKPLAESLREVVRGIDRRRAKSGEHARGRPFDDGGIILTGLRVRKATWQAFTKD